MPSSTEVPHAWPLRNVSDDELAAFLQISLQEAHKRRPVLARQLADPAWIAETLEVLPAATLAMLHLVIEAGGMRGETTLMRLALERFGMSKTDCEAALREAVKRLITVPLRTTHGDCMLAVVAPAAALIAPLVAGLDLVALSSSGFVPSESPVRNPRVFVAVCAAVRHTEIKLTTAGHVHRGSIKRLAKQVGIDETSLAVMLEVGLDIGVLRAEDDSMRLDTAALGEAAQGRYPRYAPLAVLAARLGDAPVAQQAASQLMQRSLAAEHASLPDDAIGHLPGFAIGTANGVAACMRSLPGGMAAGHVTPSFEVFLPPESRLIDVVHVGACCEWERLDRAFVARISKPSIARAVAAGASTEQILAQLAAASRHPIPQNVEAAIRDWAGSVVSATIATGHVIVVEPGVAPRVAAALARFAARELAPGVFVVDADERLREVTLALGRAGVHDRAASPVNGDPASAAPGALAPASVATVPAPGLVPAAARLRARVEAWRRGEPFEGVRDDFLDKQRAAQPLPPSTAPDRTPHAILQRWAAKHAPGLLRDTVKFMSIASLAKLLSAAELEEILDDCDEIEDLLAGVARLAVRRARPPSLARSPGSSHVSSGTLRQPPPASPRPSPALLWQRDDLRERLQHAGRHGDVLALQLASGVRYLEISRVIRRGTIWMVLGEDFANGDAVALPLDDVQAIALVPDDFDIESILLGDDDGDDFDDDDDDNDLFDDEPAVRQPWRPAPGQVAPAGHLPCPCGSGARYRNCCRAVVTA